jgi:superfamily II RNA helicase
MRQTRIGFRKFVYHPYPPLHVAGFVHFKSRTVIKCFLYSFAEHDMHRCQKKNFGIFFALIALAFSTRQLLQRGFGERHYKLLPINKGLYDPSFC